MPSIVLNSILASISLLIAVVGIFHFPVWWDEGWSLALARNFVDYGYYGQINDGALLSRGLAQSFPSIFPIILSFELFGVGIWQGRLPFLVLSIVFIIVFYTAISNLFEKRIANTSLLLLFLGAHALHPILMGVQVLGEVPMLLFAALGYLALAAKDEIVKLNRIISAVLLFTFAIIAKSQIAPFLAVGFFTSAALAFFKSKRKKTVLFLLVLAFFPLVLFVTYGYANAKINFFPNELVKPLEGLIYVSIFVWNNNTKLMALEQVLFFMLPTLLGITAFLYAIKEKKNFSFLDFIQFAYCIMCLSWMVWFVLFSVGWPRYLFPPYILSIIFLAKFIHEHTRLCSYNGISSLFRQLLPSYNLDRMAKVSFFVLSLLFFACICSWASIFGLMENKNRSLQEVVSYINSSEEIKKVESYESEIFFLLNKPYHFPPDNLNLEVLKKSLNPKETYSYTWDQELTPYLVTGQFNDLFTFYMNSKSDLVEKNLIYNNDRYSIFRASR